MKAWEALEILESLPADTEVTLTIGQPKSKGNTPLPKHNEYRWYTTSPQWVISEKHEYDKNRTTCTLQ